MQARDLQSAAGGRYRVILVAVLVMAVLGGVAAVLLLRGRQGGPSLFAELTAEDLGSGITIGMNIELAREKLGALPGSVTARVMTREELAQSDPYGEREADKDLLVVVPDTDAAPSRTVAELRAYLSPAEHSALTLQGKPVAGLTPEDVKSILGNPIDSHVSSDGRTHLTFLGRSVKGRGRYLQLVTSHDYDAGCFAVSLGPIPGS